MGRVNLFDDLLRDLRYAGRSLLRNPGFVMLAVLIMALGIGANTAVFSVVNAVLLKPLSYRDPERIVTISSYSKKGEPLTAISKQVSIPDFQDWHDQSSSFEAMAYYQSREVPVMAGPAAEYAQVAAVSPEFFRVFGVEPITGRFFTADEMKPGNAGPAAVMISEAFWNSHFSADQHVLGQSVRVFGRTLPVVGVLPRDFYFPDKTNLWVPRIVRGTESRGGQNDVAVGRLKFGVSLEQAQTELIGIAGRLEQEYPESNKGRSVALNRMRDEMVGNVRLTLYLLWGAVSVVLLIACANTATLLLGKATARTREIAVRATLGASHRRIIRQLVTESLLLASLAGALGLLFAYWGTKVLLSLAPGDLPRVTETGIDTWVLAFTLGISLATSVLFGLVPALYASKIHLNDALKQAGTRSIIGGRMVRVRGMLVVIEIALAVSLLTGAGLLIKSFVALQHVNLGFRTENVLVMRASVPAPTPEAASKFFVDVLPRIAGRPGVSAVGATMAPPGKVESAGGYFIDHKPERPDEFTNAPFALKNIVAPGTFAALGIPLKNGRDFNDSDTRDKPFVAVVNEALVQKSFGSENPIGRTIYCPFDSFTGMTIIGVVGDVHQRGPASDPAPECYMPYQQHAFNGNTLSVVVRTAGNPTALSETLRHLAQERSPEVPMKFSTMEIASAENIAVPRFRSLLFAVFAGLAVCLAMAGVYGVMAYAVGQRSNEIGLRMALGANTGSIFRLVLGKGLVLASIGLILGLTVAIAGTRMLTTMLFQVQPIDAVVYFAVAVLVGIVTLLAGYIPARQASKIDPMTALRQE